MCPQVIAEIQPSDFTTLVSGDRAVFILWPRHAAEEFLQLKEELVKGRNIYPLGTFPNGDVICWEDGFVTLDLHDVDDAADTGVPFKTERPFDQLLARVLARDPTLEREMFRKISYDEL